MKARLAAAALTFLVPACSGSPAAEPNANPSIAPSATPAASLEGRLVFERRDTPVGMEAPYVGTFVADGEGSEDLVPMDQPVDSAGAVWSPDGTQLLFNTWAPPRGPYRPGIIQPDGSEYRPLDPGDFPADLYCTAWSPDVSTVLCSVTGGIDHPELDGIYSMSIEEGRLTRLTTSPEHDVVSDAGECGGGDVTADYSPDGSRIVFIRKRCGTGADPSADRGAALFVANATGGGLERIVDFGGVFTHHATRARWSPDGNWILFGTDQGALAVVRPDGSDLTTIDMDTGGGGSFALSPDWSPDGRSIVFSLWLERFGRTDLYVANADGSNLVRVTDSEQTDEMPSWGP